jgi:protease PrsW
MLVGNLALAIGPSGLLLWWAYRRNAGRSGALHLLVYAFGLGFVAVVAALFAGVLANQARAFFGGYLRIVYDAFIVAALLEEGAKYVVIAAFISRHRAFEEVTDGIVYGMAASIGFAIVENLLYVGEPAMVLLLRAVTAVPLHAGCGALIGFYVGRAHSDSRNRAATGALLAILVHGTYDALIFMGRSTAFLSLAVVAGLAMAVPLLLRHAVFLDRRLARAGLASRPSPAAPAGAKPTGEKPTGAKPTRSP